MRVPLSWLADYVDLEMSSDELAHRLTMSGLKVDSIERIGADWDDVYVGAVVELAPHPTSTKPLHVAQVQVGGQTIVVVTGAQNVKLGDKVPVVRLGGLIPHGPDGEPMRIESRPMAGITSEGMLASARELGISDEHAGIYILPEDTPVGAPLRTILGGDVLDIETNPNRADTLSIIGVAREVAALTDQQITPADLDAIENVDWLDEDSISLQVDAPELCPRYTAVRIEGVQVKPSPSWMAQRLQAAGMRPINLIVDITNYAMLEYGQPMHAFDARALKGNRIVVRRAHEGERLTTLDGVVRELTAQDLVIADGEQAVAIAGVMGGESSEISDDTSDLILESANFDAVSVRRTAQSLGLRTEASSRFEKGLPPEQTELGARRFIQLLAQLSDSPLRVRRFSDRWIGRLEPREVAMPVRDVQRLIGITVPVQEAADRLSLLGFGVRYDDEQVIATVPFWRRGDIELSADLVEEVARLIGFDAVPATLPRQTLPPEALPLVLRLEGVVRHTLLAAGASEAVTHGLTSPAALLRLARSHVDDKTPLDDAWAKIVPNPAGVYEREALIQPIGLRNPATRDRQVMRLALLPSLLEVVARNVKHTDERISFFEIDNTFFMRPNNRELPYERRALALALSGRRSLISWADPRPTPFTFHDVKGMLVAVLQALRVPDWTVEPCAHPALHPGRSAVLRVGGHDVAYLGELHPDVALAFDVEGWPVQVAEVDLDALFVHAHEEIVFHPLPRYPAAFRDIAVVVDAQVPAARLIEIVRANGDQVLESASVFDVYHGGPLPAGKKSVAIGMTFRAPGATLTQEDVQTVTDRIVDALARELAAVLRD
ncbi:MAG: phenylalanine--tRNA ligase subunit beta [Chloroflexota bacterium]